MKYKNLKELAAAYLSGELGSDNILWLDNDTAHMYVDGEKVFDSDPNLLLEQALLLLGVEAEHV